jgi:Na+/proline symporter
LLRLHVNPFDYTILGIYFALVVTIGVMARRAVATSEDFLLFDLRVLIGGLFLVYGVMLTVAGTGP